VRLETERLRLHRFEPGDESAAAGFLCDPEVARHLLMVFDAERQLAPNVERFRENFAGAWQDIGLGGVLVSLRRGGEAVGFIALKRHSVPGREIPGAFEIYFGLARERWGRGYAFEAVGAYLEALETRLQPVSVHASINRAQNPRGCRVLEKLGFGFERWLPLPELVRGPLARGSLELELWRASHPSAGRPRAEVLAEAAFRVGQLLESAEMERAEAEARLLEAAAVGGSAERAEAIVRERLPAGLGEARYAVYGRRGASAASA
jgi:RimJ/RimL family protein N-acetyltransferase